MLNWCRSYSFDDNIFKVDVPVFDVSYFSQKNIYWQVAFVHASSNVIKKFTPGLGIPYLGV